MKSYLQGTPKNERKVTLRREKRDVDLLVACDDECLPEDQIKDYDVLLQYDDETEPGPGSFFVDFEREPCAFVCKIVGMNKTDGSNDILDGEFTITSVEESSDENDFETSNFFHYPPLRTMVGTRKNVSFSSTTKIENVTTSYELPNATSPCPCKNNGTNTTKEITTTTPRPIAVNATESTTLSNKNSSSLLLIKDIQENATAKSDFQSIVINETTTQQQQLFSVVPVIPKVIRFTVVEAEMAEAGVNTTQNSDKTQDNNNYKDIKNNVSLAFQSFLESLAPLESLGLGNIGLGNVTHLVNQNFTLTPWSPKLSQIAEEVIASQTLPPPEPTTTRPIIETLNSDRTTKKSVEEAFQLVPSVSNSSLNSLQDDTSLLTTSNVITNVSVIANFNGAATTTPALMKASPTFDVSSTNIEHTIISTKSSKLNRSISDQNTSPKPEEFSKLIGVLTTESPKELSNTTTSSPSNGTISSNSSEILTSSTNITHSIGNVSNPTGINLHSSNKSLNNDSIVLDTLNSYKENNTTTEDYKLSQSNTTHSTNQTTFKDDVGKETGNHTIGKLPLDSGKSSTLSSISDSMKKNVTI